MDDLDKDCKVDDDYSFTKQMNGKVTWIIDKGIWLGKKAVITGAVISSAPLVLPPLVVFSTLGLACSVPFGFVFATYACTQKIMSKLLPTPESSSVLEYNKDDMEVIDLVQGAGAEEERYDLEDVDLVQGAAGQENDDLVQRAEEQGYEEDEEEEVDLEQAPEEQEMKDTPADVKEGDILQEKPIDTMGFGVTTTELNGRNDVLSEGAALSQEDVLYGEDGMQIYNEEPVEQEKLMLDVVEETRMKNVLDDAITSMDIHKQKSVVEEKQLKEVVEGAATILEPNVNDTSEPERGHSYQACVYDGKNDFAVLKKESDEMKRDILMRNDMDGEAKNETQEGSTSQANEIFARKCLVERPIKIIEHGPEGEYKEDTTKCIQVEDVLSVEGTDVRNEKPIIEDINDKPVIGMRQVIVSVHSSKQIAGEQENEDIKECNKSQKHVLVAKKVTDEAVGDIKSVVERATTGDLNSAREIADECGLDLFDYTAGDHDSYNDFNICQGAALSQEDVLYGEDGMQIYNQEPLEQEELMLDVVKETGMKIVLDDAITGMDIHKQKPVVEEKQLKEVVEGASTILELNVNDTSEPERGHSYQARVYDGKNDFAVLKTDEMKRDFLMKNDMDGGAKNENQEGSTAHANENVRKILEERAIKIIEHGHERDYKEDTTKYIQVKDVPSVEGTDVRNEKPIIEDMNDKPVIRMRQVIVSVHSGKQIAGEQENENIKECNKSQKLVLVAKKVTDETVGDTKSVVERTTAGDLNSAREIADECGLDLFDYTAGDHDSYNDFNLSQENDNIRSSKISDVADLPFLRVSTKVAVSKHINLQPETDPLTPCNEELLDEEKIWEQIDALRAILGYSAPMHATSVEEIKALYIFTGVEPPASLADNPDVVEMNEKLRLLKSVVGVK